MSITYTYLALACENSRFLSLLVARDVLRGGTSVDWHQAPNCGKREKKIGVREKKNRQAKRAER